MTYAQAARELNVTEAAVRQHVRKLEKYFGSPLAVREGRGLALTEEGRRLAAGLSDGFAIIQTTSEQLISQIARRPVRVALTPAFAENWLMARLPEFWLYHPDIEIDLSPSIKPVDLSRGYHDLAIRYGRGNWTEDNVKLIASADYTVVVSPNFQGSVQENNLQGLLDDIWLFEGDREEHRQWANSHGLDFDASRNRHYPNNSLVLSAVRAGHGISVQSWALVEKDIRSGALISLFRQEVEGLGYYLLYQRELTKNATSFATWLDGPTAANDL